MKKTFQLFLYLFFLYSSLFSQDIPMTTFILVRHAEKADDGSKDPGLSLEGMARAERLAAMLGDAGITAIYSTDYKRTMNTVKDFAAQKNLAVQKYEALKGEALDKILADNTGGKVLIVGHSNTVPWTANYFLGTNTTAKPVDFMDDEFDNMLIVTVVGGGRAGSVVRLKY